MKPRLTYNQETNTWNLETPVALNLRQVDAVVKYTKEIYKLRLNGTLGQKRKDMEWALKSLHYKNIKQQLVGEEPTLFYSDKY